MPPSARDIRAGRAFVEIGARDDALTRGLRRAQRRLRAFGAQVQSVGRSLATIGVAGAVPFALSLRTYAAFEQQMARVQALTGATGKELKALNDEAQRLGRTTVFSASQAAEAMSFFALAGFSVAEILEAIEPTLRLAAAGQIEIAQAADIASKAMRAMGIDASEVGRIADVLTKGFTTANTDLVQLGEAFKFVGPVARSAGVEFEELVAAIQILSNAGLQGEMAGTALRGILLTLTSPSKEAADELQRLGVTIADDEGKVRSLAEIVGQLSTALSSLPQAERLRVIGTIFPNRQASGAAVLLAEGSDELQKFTQALLEAGGTAERIARVQLNTFRGALIILRSATEGLGIAIGESIVGPIRIATVAITDIVSRLTTWVKANKDIVAIGAGVILFVLGLAGALLAVGVTAKVAAFALGGLAVFTKLAAVAFGLLTTVIGAIASPIGIAILGFGALALGIARVTGLTGRAAGAIGAFGDFLAGRFAVLRDIVSRTLAGIRDAIAAGDIELAAQILWTGLRILWLEGTQDIQRMWLNLKRVILSVWNQVFFGLVSALQIGVNAIEVAWVETTSFLGKTWTKFATGYKTIWENAVSFASKRILELQGLFDESLDVEAAKKGIDNQLKNRIDELREEAFAALRSRESQRATARRNLRDENTRTLAAIGAEFEAAQDALEQSTTGKIEQAKKDLEDAKKRLEESTAEAARKRAEVEAEGGGGGILGRLRDLESTLAEAATGVRRVSVRSTFNAATATQLGAADNAVNRTAKATEETAKNTKRVADALRNAQPIAFT